MKKKILFAAIIVLIAAGGAVLGLWKQGYFQDENDKLNELIKNQPAMIELYNEALAEEQKIKGKPDEPQPYFTAGIKWKSVAEQMNGTEEVRNLFFKKSLSVYEQGIEKFGRQNILFYVNAGNIAQRVNDFGKAEKYYEQAIEISPADESPYLALVDLYYYKMNKSKEEILPVFEKGIKIMLNPAPLLSGRATYLRRINEYEAALADYRRLSEIFPDNYGYKEIIAELEAKL